MEETERKKITRGDELLMAIAACGELPARLVPDVVGSDSYAAALVTRLKGENQIACRCKDGLKGYVLHRKGKNYLMDVFPGRMRPFLEGGCKPLSGEKREIQTTAPAPDGICLGTVIWTWGRYFFGEISYPLRYIPSGRAGRHLLLFCAGQTEHCERGRRVPCLWRSGCRGAWILRLSYHGQPDEVDGADGMDIPVPDRTGFVRGRGGKTATGAHPGKGHVHDGKAAYQRRRNQTGVILSG